MLFFPAILHLISPPMYHSRWFFLSRVALLLGNPSYLTSGSYLLLPDATHQRLLSWQLFWAHSWPSTPRMFFQIWILQDFDSCKISDDPKKDSDKTIFLIHIQQLQLQHDHWTTTASGIFVWMYGSLEHIELPNEARGDTTLINICQISPERNSDRGQECAAITSVETINWVSAYGATYKYHQISPHSFISPSSHLQSKQHFKFLNFYLKIFTTYPFLKPTNLSKPPSCRPPPPCSSSQQWLLS